MSQQLYSWAFILEKWKCVFPQNSVYTNIHNSFIHISKTAQMSFSWWMDKQAVVHPHCGILLGNKKEDTTDACNNLDESPEYYVELKKISKHYILCDSIYIMFLKW